MTTFRQGELRLAVMGDLLRNPGTSSKDVQQRLEVHQVDTVRITLLRMKAQGLVRRVGPGRFMLTRAGLDHLATVRRWVSA